MPTKQDIQRLREDASDEVIFNYLRGQDAGFKTSVNRVQNQNPNMGALEEAQFPSAMIDLYYGIKPKKSDPLTTQMASAAFSKGTDTQSDDRGVSFAGDVIRNVPASAARFAGDIFNAVSHPFKTAGALADTVIGGGANAIETIAGIAGVQNPEQIFDLESEKVANAVGDFFVERYGDKDKIKETIRTDPVGFAADLAGMLSIAGGALKGAGFVARGAEATGRAGVLSKIGTVAAKAGELVDPAVLATRPIKATTKALSPGKAAERIVSSTLKLKPKDINKIAKGTVAGQDASKWLLNNTDIGKGGARSIDDIVEMLDRSTKASKKQVDSKLASIDIAYNIKKDIPQVNRAIDQLSEMLDPFPELKAEHADVLAMKGQAYLSLEDINKVKRAIDDLESPFKQTGDVKEALGAREIFKQRDKIKKFIEAKAKENGIPNIRELNKNTQVARQIKDAIIDAANRRTPNNLVRLSDFLVGGIGLGVGFDPISAAGIVIGNRLILSNPKVRTFVARQLNKLSMEEVSALDDLTRTQKMSNTAKDAIKKVFNPIEKILEIEGAETLLIETPILMERSSVDEVPQ